MSKEAGEGSAITVGGNASFADGAKLKLRLTDMAALFWHCLAERGDLTRDAVGEAGVAQGRAASTKLLRILLGEILKGRV